MGLIFRSAYIRVCDCKLHACVVLPNGVESDEFGSRMNGLAIIMELRQMGCIEEEEMSALKEALENSPLPFSPGIVDAIFSSCEKEVEEEEEPRTFRVRIGPPDPETIRNN